MYAYDNKLKLELIQDAEKRLISLNSDDKNAVNVEVGRVAWIATSPRPLKSVTVDRMQLGIVIPKQPAWP